MCPATIGEIAPQFACDELFVRRGRAGPATTGEIARQFACDEQFVRRGRAGPTTTGEIARQFACDEQFVRRGRAGPATTGEIARQFACDEAIRVGVGHVPTRFSASGLCVVRSVRCWVGLEYRADAPRYEFLV